MYIYMTIVTDQPLQAPYSNIRFLLNYWGLLDDTGLIFGLFQGDF